MTTTTVAADPWVWVPHPVLWAALATFGAGTALLHRRMIGAAAHPTPWPLSLIHI